MILITSHVFVFPRQVMYLSDMWVESIDSVAELLDPPVRVLFVEVLSDTFNVVELSDPPVRVFF